MGPFWGAVFHENTSGKSKFSSKGAEFYSSIAPMSGGSNSLYSRVAKIGQYLPDKRAATCLELTICPTLTQRSCIVSKYRSIKPR